MYEDYMQNFFNYQPNDYQNTYDQTMDSYPYGYNYNRNMSMCDYNPGYQMYNPSQRGMSDREMEDQ